MRITPIALCIMTLSAVAEAPYSFRDRLVTVHRTDRRDFSLKASAEEFAFANGSQIAVADDAPELVRRAAEDFREYLVLSMGVNASVRNVSAPPKPGLVPSVEIRLAPAEKRGYSVETGPDGVKIAAADDKMAAQAFYHLEDLMNLRRGPFLKKGTERRSPVFDHRFTFSGFGDDIFPDGHLNQIAHHGFTGIEIWLDDYDVISQGVRQDVNDLLERAAQYGLDAFFQPRNRAFVHPDDPGSAEMYDKAYGALAKYYPKAYGISFCGEVCNFPSKDKRANGGDHRDRSTVKPGDTRPFPGWFPCYDWADWVKAVMPIVHRYNPGCKFVFCTYNWGFQDEKARAELIAALPKGVTLIPTFEMFEKHVKRNGLVSPVADYSLAFPGPGKYFATEAAQAKAAGLELWSNCNSAGLTWDFGNIPYQPAPWQWKKKWDALKSAHGKWNLTGLRENHEYGWYPSFVSELEKECMWEGGMDFDAHVRAIAARDFGEANAAKAITAWKAWSRAADDYVPTDENQYGPCRIGPAYPFNYFGKDLQPGWKAPADFPLTPGFMFDICHFDYGKPIKGLGTDAVSLEESELKEIELFESQASDYRHGTEIFRMIAASLPDGRRDEAVRMAALGEYLMRACLTAVHVKRGRIAWRKGDRAEVLRLARAEYANAKAALAAVDADSRLGWLASSDYTGSRAQIEWKLRKMRELYGGAAVGEQDLARFELQGLPVKFFYDAVKPIEAGDGCDVAVVLVHGWGGGGEAAAEQLPLVKALAAAVGEGGSAPYVIAPLFPRYDTLKRVKTDYDGRAVWNVQWEKDGSPGDDWRGGGDAVGTTFSSYDVIDSIFAAFGDRGRYPNLRRVVLTGFSAGGQFAGRYAAVGKGFVREGVEVAYAAMAPSTEFRYDPETEWLYGLKNRPRYPAAVTDAKILANLSSRRVWRGCGTEDVLSVPYTSLDITPAAMAQGTNRYDRFCGFERYLKRYPAWAKQVTFHPFTGIGHKTVLAHTDKAFIDFVLGPDPERK